MEEEIQLWGGAECTVNRVGEQYLDQIQLTGHQDRPGDLDLFAGLGISALRYPILWEKICPVSLSQPDWDWTDQRLGRLRELGIRPIASLIHHGSGPRFTSLADPGFAAGLTTFARQVAERYPWIDHYTPVNEPLTTARFSGLYGHWFPHGRDDRTFVRCLLNQCRAVVEAMAAIREVNPAAKLVQTDDLGKTSSTPLLTYQADLENQRRWLTFDLLCGRFDRGHPLWNWLVACGGVGEAELEWFQENPCPPDIMGINHYLSSERYLDEHLERYPAESHGGNARHAYADELSARIKAGGAFGPRALLREAWERYHLPLAVTEVHNGCTREEQMRWFVEVWEAARSLRAEGIDIRAVTAWSLLGVHGWDQLASGHGGTYEVGVFDARDESPRPTAMVPLLRSLAAGQVPNEPLLAIPGWWRRPERHIWGFSLTPGGEYRVMDAIPDINECYPAVPPLLIVGANGTLGRAFARLCQARGIPYRLLRRHDMDIADARSVEDALQRLRPWAVVNAAGYVRVDEAEGDEAACFRDNTRGPAVLATTCAQASIPLVTFSSDLVFDGRSRRPYLESDPTAPLSVYGRSKAEAEEAVLAAHPGALVIRTSAFFGPWDTYNFAYQVLRTLREGETVLAARDQVISPTYVPDLVQATLDLLIDRATGIWHLANQGAVSWLQLGQSIAQRATLDPRRVVGKPNADLGLIASRPAYSVLGSRHGSLLPSLDSALDRFMKDLETLPAMEPAVSRQ